MELDDLLREEGLDAAGVDDALAWARRRAAELVRDVGHDPELGPLLDGASALDAHVPAPSRPRASTPSLPPSSAPAVPQPLFNDLRGLQAAFLAEAEDEEDDLPEVGAVLRAFKKGRSSSTRLPAISTSEDAAPAPVGPAATEPVVAAAAASEATPAEATASEATASEATASEATASETAAEATPVETAAEATPVETAAEAMPSDAAVEAMPSDAAAEAMPSDAAVEATPREAAIEPAAVEATPVEAEAVRTEPSAGETAADHGVPAPPEVDLDPLAGIDFDDLPGVDEDEDDEADHTHVDLPSVGQVLPVDHDLEARTTLVPGGAPDATMPSMAEVTLTMGRIDPSLTAGELTERVRNPLLPAELASEVTVKAKAPAPEGAEPAAPVEEAAPVEAAPAEAPEAEEIELLDDEDLLLVEEEDADEDEEVPEWKQALASAQGDAAAAPPAAADDEAEEP